MIPGPRRWPRHVHSALTLWAAAALAALLFSPSCLQAADDVVFAAYNVKNYLRMDRFDGKTRQTDAPKPEAEIQALVQIIKEIDADILGVCEMGKAEDFEDFKKRLAEAGLGYKHFEHVQAADPARHLALLSRYPITSRQSVTRAGFTISGAPEQVRRGFLDVTVEVTKEYSLRLVGAHLKSKLPIPQGEALVRRHEAQLLRQHIDTILAADPQANLLVYGDFNDTRNEPPVQEIMGKRGSPTQMRDLWLRDSVGDRWTYYWKTADSYSRIDYILVSPALWPEILLPKSSIYRSQNWEDASDHRPVIAAIHPVNQQ